MPNILAGKHLLALQVIEMDEDVADKKSLRWTIDNGGAARLVVVVCDAAARRAADDIVVHRRKKRSTIHFVVALPQSPLLSTHYVVVLHPEVATITLFWAAHVALLPQCTVGGKGLFESPLKSFQEASGHEFHAFELQLISL